jgi:hypothetical protein
MRRASESEAARAFWERGRAMLACGIFEQIHVSVPHVLAVSAHVAAAIGLPDEGLIDIDRGLALVAQTGEAHSESKLYRAKGEIVLAMGDSISGERNFRVARAIARRQSAKGLELRAAISLARLLLQQRRSDEAYDILTPVHDWFQQGFDEPIMRQVQSLRDALDRTRCAIASHGPRGVRLTCHPDSAFRGINDDRASSHIRRCCAAVASRSRKNRAACSHASSVSPRKLSTRRKKRSPVAALPMLRLRLPINCP